MFIKIANKKHKITFGYGALRILAAKFKLKKLSELDTVFSKLNFKENEEPTIAQMDLLAALVMAGILNANSKCSVSESELADEIFLKNPDQLQAIMEFFSESMPKNQGK